MPGSQAHAEAIQQAKKELEASGYRVIITEGGLTHTIAVKSDRLYGIPKTKAVFKVRKRKRGGATWKEGRLVVNPTTTSLLRRYRHLDGLLIIHHKRGENRREAWRAFLAAKQGEGFRIIPLQRKRPDGVLLKDGKVIALEVLGFNPASKKRGWAYDQKREAYSMFDGVMFKTFERRAT